MRHVDRDDPLVELLLGEFAGLQRRGLQGEALLVGVLGDLGGLFHSGLLFGRDDRHRLAAYHRARRQYAGNCKAQGYQLRAGNLPPCCALPVFRLDIVPDRLQPVNKANYKKTRFNNSKLLITI